MSDISNIYSNAGAVYESTYAGNAGKADSAKSTENTKNSTSKIPGHTIGNPTLSDKAQEYYKELRSKFHNMEFILVSQDQKENAKQHASSYAMNGKMVVLIDDEKLERMATDSSYRAKYEDIIDKAANSFNQFSASASATGANIKGYGMQVNDDGTTSLFAVLEKSTKDQAKRIEEKREANRAAKKEEAKKAQKERLNERIESSKEAKKSEKAGKTEDSDKVVITANSWDELLKKIEDHVQMERSDSVMTESEKQVGQSIDFSV